MGVESALATAGWRMRRVIATALFLLVAVLPTRAEPDSSDHLQQSLRSMQQGDLETAEAEASLALANPATEPVAYALLGSIRLQQERFEEGIEYLESAVAADPSLVGARLNLAQAYAFLDKKDRARSLFRSVLEIAPDNDNARLALMKLASEAGSHKEVLELAKPVAGLLRSSPDGLLLLVAAHAEAGNEEEVRELAADWSRVEGASSAGTLRFAHLIAETGLRSEAIGLLEELKRDGRNSYGAASYLAGLYLLEGDLRAASANAELAVAFDEKSVPALLQAARIAERERELEKGLSFMIRAKRQAPDDPEVLFAFGTLALRLELVEDATEALAKTLELRPGHEATRYWLGTAKGAAGHYDASLALYQGLLEESPDDSQLHFAVGSVRYLQSEFEDAARHLEASRRIEPGQLLSRYYLGMVAQKTGQDSRAIGLFEDVLEDFPDHALSHEGLAMSHFRLRHYEAARESFKRAIALDPESARAHYQLGQLLARMGLREEAQRQLAVAKGLREEEERTQLVWTLLNPH